MAITCRAARSMASTEAVSAAPVEIVFEDDHRLGPAVADGLAGRLDAAASDHGRAHAVALGHGESYVAGAASRRASAQATLAAACRIASLPRLVPEITSGRWPLR